MRGNSGARIRAGVNLISQGWSAGRCPVVGRRCAIVRRYACLSRCRSSRRSRRGCWRRARRPNQGQRRPPVEDASFQQVADEFLTDYFKRNPTTSTYLGIHDYDSELEDASKAAVDAEIATLKRFREPVCRDRRSPPVTGRSARSRAGAVSDRFAAARTRGRALVGDESRRLQQRARLDRLHHDQARVRAGARPSQSADCARETDARGARRGAKESRQPAGDLHRHRDRAA